MEEFTVSVFHIVKEIVSGRLYGLLFEEQLKYCSKKFTKFTCLFIFMFSTASASIMYYTHGWFPYDLH
jgi:hypothetical protein